MDTLKVYLAGAAWNRNLINIVQNYLEMCYPMKVISRWHQLDPEYDLRTRAKIDFEDIDLSDLIIVFYPYGDNGTLCELSYSFARRKKVLYVRPKDAEEEDPLIVGLFPKDFLFNTNLELYSYLNTL